MHERQQPYLENWQRYDEQGRPEVGLSAPEDVVYRQGLLHGAAHVWIWRKSPLFAEVLLKKLDAHSQTWPDRLDTPVAGQINRGELPIETAVRESKKQIGIEIDENNLSLLAVHRTCVTLKKNLTINEFRWLYLLEQTDQTEFTRRKLSVDWLRWKTLREFQDATHYMPDQYVPRGDAYYQTVISAISKNSSPKRQNTPKS